MPGTMRRFIITNTISGERILNTTSVTEFQLFVNKILKENKDTPFTQLEGDVEKYREYIEALCDNLSILISPIMYKVIENTQIESV